MKGCLGAVLAAVAALLLFSFGVAVGYLSSSQPLAHGGIGTPATAVASPLP